jgi:hypothetical protein
LASRFKETQESYTHRSAEHHHHHHHHHIRDEHLNQIDDIALFVVKLQQMLDNLLVINRTEKNMNSSHLECREAQGEGAQRGVE